MRQFKKLRSALRGGMIVGFLAICFVTSTATAQDVFVYPSRRQTTDQQNRDKYECTQWATQQTGFNPSAPQPSTYGSYPAPPPVQQPTAGPLKGAVGGAAIGAVGGAIGGNAGKGAAIGAAAGALFGGFRRMEQSKQQQAQQNAYQQQVASAQAQQAATANAQRANFNRAFATCLQGRGYTVN